MQLELSHIANEQAVSATMATLKRIAERNTLGFARAEFGSHYLQVFNTATGRTLYTVDDIQIAARLVPGFILKNWL